MKAFLKFLLYLVIHLGLGYLAFIEQHEFTQNAFPFVYTVFMVPLIAVCGYYVYLASELEQRIDGFKILIDGKADWSLLNSRLVKEHIALTKNITSKVGTPDNKVISSSKPMVILLLAVASAGSGWYYSAAVLIIAVVLQSLMLAGRVKIHELSKESDERIAQIYDRLREEEDGQQE